MYRILCVLLNASMDVQGKYTVTPGANPGSHLWLLCNPGLPRRTPFVVDLGGSELVFMVCFRVLPHPQDIYQVLWSFHALPLCQQPPHAGRHYSAY